VEIPPDDRFGIKIFGRHSFNEFVLSFIVFYGGDQRPQCICGPTAATCLASILSVYFFR